MTLNPRSEDTAATDPSWWVGRRGVVHLVEAGRTDSDASLSRSFGETLTAITQATFDGCRHTEQLEVLALPAARGYACCLHPQTTPNGAASARTPIPAADGGTATVVEAAKQYLPEVFGIETGNLWLHPLTAGRTVTDRAVVADRNWTLTSDSDPFQAMHRWARNRDRGPLAYQLLIQAGAGSGFHLTLRATELGEHAPARDRAIGRTLTKGVTSPIQSVFPEHVQSARTLATNEWETTSSRRAGTPSDPPVPTLGFAAGAESLHPSKPIRARESLASFVESQGFLNATPLNAQYEDFDVNPRLQVDRSDLTRFLDVFPLPSHTKVRAIDQCQPPRLDRTAVLRDPTATDRTAVLPTPTAPEWRTPPHDSPFLSVATRWFAPDRVTTTDPWDARMDTPHIDGESPTGEGLVAFVDPDATHTDVPIGTAAGIVAVANHAVATGHTLHVVGADADAGQWAARVLEHPFQATHQKTGEPYQLPMPWVVDKSIVPVANQAAATGWRVTPDGRWVVHVNQDVRAHGHIDAPNQPTTLECDRLVPRGDNYELRTRDDEFIAEYPTIAALDDDYLPIKQARMPRCPTFADYATIWYSDTTSLRPVDTPPQWTARYNDSLSTGYLEAAAREFTDTHTIPRRGDAPPAENVDGWFSRYVRSQASHDLDTLARKPLSTFFETPVERTSDGAVVLPDRAWPVPVRTTPTHS